MARLAHTYGMHFLLKDFFSRNLSTVIFSNYLTLNSLKYKKPKISH